MTWPGPPLSLDLDCILVRPMVGLITSIFLAAGHRMSLLCIRVQIMAMFQHKAETVASKLSLLLKRKCINGISKAINNPSAQSTTMSSGLTIFFSLIHQWVLCIWFLTGNSIRLLSSNAPNGHYIENAGTEKSIKWRQVLPGWWWKSKLMQVIWSHVHQSVASVRKVSGDWITPGLEISWNFFTWTIHFSWVHFSLAISQHKPCDLNPNKLSEEQSGFGFSVVCEHQTRNNCRSRRERTFSQYHDVISFNDNTGPVWKYLNSVKMSATFIYKVRFRCIFLIALAFVASLSSQSVA